MYENFIFAENRSTLANKLRHASGNPWAFKANENEIFLLQTTLSISAAEAQVSNKEFFLCVRRFSFAHALILCNVESSNSTLFSKNVSLTLVYTETWYINIEDVINLPTS